MQRSRHAISGLASCASLTVCHPFLFSANAVLIDWLSNFDQVLPYVVLPPLLLSLSLAGGLYLTARLLLRDRFQAGLVSSLVLLVVLHYGSVLDPLQSLPGAARLKWIPLLAAAVILVAITAVTRRRSDSAQRLNPILNLISAVWLVMAVVPLVSAQLQVLSLRTRHLEAQPLSEVGHPLDAPNRDVYYIILDGYGRQDELLTDYQFDNSWFIAELRRMGFVVPECTLSNYAFTALSLPSSLNMAYIQDLGLDETKDHPTIEYRELADYINYSEVQRRFELMGYKTVAVNNGIRWAQLRRADNINPSGMVTNFIAFGDHFLSKTAFRLLLSPDLDLPGAVKYRRTLEVFDALQAIPELDGPIFAFLHILAPHYPFAFGEDGQYIQERAASVDADPEGYRAQYRAEMTYLNRRVLEAFSVILAESETPPIIVVQGDHSWALSNKTQMQILNAYYLPDGGADRLHSHITPVNTFRLVLDYYFGEDHGLVEDRSYFSNYVNSPYGFEEYPGNCAELPLDRYPSLFSDTVARAPARGWGEQLTRLMEDVNGDGKSDLMAFTPEGASLAISTGENFLLSSRYWIWGEDDAVAWPDPREVVHGDINGDGRPDVVGFGPDRLIVSYGSRH